MRLGVAAFLWANIMAFSVVLYVGYFEQISASASRILPWLLFALTTPMIFYCAFPILRSAAIGLWNRQIRMEVLLSLGVLAAYGLSIGQTLLGPDASVLRHRSSARDPGSRGKADRTRCERACDALHRDALPTHAEESSYCRSSA